MSLVRGLNHDLLKAQERAVGTSAFKTEADAYVQATKSLLEKANKLLDKSLQLT